MQLIRDSTKHCFVDSSADFLARPCEQQTRSEEFCESVFVLVDITTTSYIILPDNLHVMCLLHVSVISYVYKCCCYSL